MNITIDGSDLKAVSLFRSTDSTRYVLNGVLLDVISEKEYLLVATDGRMLFVLREPNGEIEGFENPFQVILPVQVLNHVKPSTKKRKHPYIITVSDTDGNLSARKKVTLEDVHDSISYSQFEIDGKFPNWKQCVPKGDLKASSQSDCFNPSFAAIFQKAGILIGQKDKYLGVRFLQTEPHTPFFVISDGWKSRDVLALLMPIRDYNEAPNTPKTPEWVF